MRTATRMPLWAKVVPLTLVTLLAAWWLVDRHDRVTLEQRLAAVAGDIADRPVEVRCPGLWGKLLAPADTRAGSVPYDEGGPTGHTKLAAATCAELDALTEGGRAEQLACAGRSTSCGEDVQQLAWAVNTLAHEAFHLRGIMDEALTECYAMQTLAPAAQQLGATPEQARGLAVLHWETSPGKKGSMYQVPPGCAEGGEHDIRKADPVFP